VPELCLLNLSRVAASKYWGRPFLYTPEQIVDHPFFTFTPCTSTCNTIVSLMYASTIASVICFVIFRNLPEDFMFAIA